MAALAVMSCGDSPQEIGTYSPEPSVLSAQADTTDAVDLTWTGSTEDEEYFDRYVLYRSESDSISADTTNATRLAAITDQSDTTYRDEGLGWDASYYYALVTVSYIDGGRSWSNEVMATTPPQP
jgi:fibronectin type 3 domain-containing protein